MRTKTLLDETTPAALGPERQALEPPHIVVIEEHVAHSDDTLVDLVRMTGEDDTFRDDAVGARGQRGTRGYEAELAGRRSGRVRGYVVGGTLKVE